MTLPEPGGAYQGKYSHSSLRMWSKRILDWVEQKRRAYVYFDNDQAGYAAQNALELSQMVREGDKWDGTKEKSAPKARISLPPPIVRLQLEVKLDS